MTEESLLAENLDLRQRLEEAEETLRAIQSGGVDAVVVQESGAHRVYTLEGADRPYRVMVEQMQQGAATLHADGTIAYGNSRLAELLGVPHERLVNLSLRGFIEPEDVALYEGLLHEGQTRAGRGEIRVRGTGGAPAPCYMTFNALPSDCGAAVGVLVTDLTAQRHHERLAAAREALEFQSRRFDRTLSSITDFAYTFDLEGRFTFANKPLLDLWGLTLEQVIGKDFFDLKYPPELAGRLRNQIREVVESGRRVVDETPYTNQRGEEGFYQYIFSPAFGAAGEVEAVAGSTRDITVLKRFEDEREHLLAMERAARAEAERAGRLKDDFLATLSHELRTPLNAVLGWAQILRKKPPSPETLEQGLAVIDRNARMQSQLIGDLLDMSRIISGQMRLDIQRVELPVVIGAALDAVGPAAEAKGVAVESTLVPLDEAVSGDPARLQQVVWNLVSNAVKFTPRGGRVRVALIQVGPQLELSVSDTGRGISPGFLPHVFERFRQADSSAAREHGGLGLGLAIVKQLVELHGGTVIAESGGDGKGSTFTVRLPLSAAAAERSEEPGELPRAVVPSPVHGDPPNLEGVRVLVVDDEPDARELVRRVLRECGAEVVLASSAAEGLAAAERTQVHVVVSDIGLPGRDGYDFMRALRRSGCAAPAAALTAFARQDDRARALSAGYQAHLSKPVEPEALLGAVASLAQKRPPATHQTLS